MTTLRRNAVATVSVAAIDLMCGAQADPDTPIREADLTGVLVPK
ncbi:hypothetical protein ACWFRF_01195 [Nocardia sp. NPDC055165]